MKTRHESSMINNNFNKNSLLLANSSMPSSVIKLKQPPVNVVKEILDLDYLIMDNSHLSLSSSSSCSSTSSSASCSPDSCSTTNTNNYYNNNNNMSSYHKNMNPPVFNLSSYNKNKNNVNSNNRSSNSVNNKYFNLPYQNKKNVSPRSSVTNNSAYNSDASSISTSSNDEALSFQEFVCSIVNSDDKEWQTLIIQDIARLLELKFRKFKKDLVNSSSSSSQTVSQQSNFSNNDFLVSPNIRNICINSSNNNSSSSNNIDGDLFYKLAESIFKTAIEEPNGILGARIKMRLMLDGGNNNNNNNNTNNNNNNNNLNNTNNEKIIDICDFFSYDSHTLATSEITVTIREGSSGLKKFLQAFKLSSGFVKYIPLYVDTSYFDLSKRKLY